MALQCDHLPFKVLRATIKKYLGAPVRLTQSAYMCLRSGNFKDFYLCVFAALSNVSQTYVDSLNAMLIRIHSLLKILEFCSLLSYALEEPGQYLI